MAKQTVYVISYIRTNMVRKKGNEYVPMRPKRTLSGYIFATYKAAKEVKDHTHSVHNHYSILPKIHKIVIDL